MIDTVKQLYATYMEFTKDNQLVGAAVAATVMGSLIFMVKELPMKIYRWIKSRVIVGIDLEYDNNYDNRYTYELASKYIKPKSMRWLSRRCSIGKGEGDEWFIKSGTGMHLFLSGLRPFWYVITRSDAQSGNVKFKMSIETFGISISSVERLMEDILKSREEEQCTTIYSQMHGGWSGVKAQTRSFDTVTLNGSVESEIKAAVDEFRVSKERYEAIGVPHKIGILLYGPPGTGKTSVTRAIAAYFGSDIYSINMGEMSDSALSIAMRSVPKGNVVLFEDIDCTGIGGKRLSVDEDEDGESPAAGGTIQLGVTLSGLLNVLDGIKSPEDIIIVMTTNHPEKLDPALIRKGRVDYKWELERLNESAISRYCSRVFGEQLGVVVPFPIAGCEVQHAMLCARGDVNLFRESIKELEK